MLDKDAFIFALLAENQRLRQECMTDALTSIGNRLKFETIYNHCWHNSYRYKESIAVIAIDVDNFKRFNSQLGHVEADKILCEIASAIVCFVRLSDTVCRYGGDEFVIILPKTDLEEATVVAERLRSLVAKTGYTISLGVSATVPRVAYDQPKLLSAAFIAMNKAKELGKNQVYSQSMFLPEAVERSCNSSNKLKILE